MRTPTGWFADLSDDEDGPDGARWQPILQCEGMCLPLPIWFATEDACLEFIRTDVAGKGLLDAVESTDGRNDDR